jgi:hypothetical protein
MQAEPMTHPWITSACQWYRPMTRDCPNSKARFMMAFTSVTLFLCVSMMISAMFYPKPACPEG